MAMRKVEFVVLCEDKNHESFIIRYLRRLGFNRRQIRPEPRPVGRGAGEQWVRKRYPLAAEIQRSKANRSRASLIVIIDADTMSTEERKQQLDDALDAAGQARRGGSERIALVVPRRNIESWVHFTLHAEIDETTDFKPRHRDASVWGSADAAVRVHRSGSDETAVPPSLVAACQELRRVVAP